MFDSVFILSLSPIEGAFQYARGRFFHKRLYSSSTVITQGSAATAGSMTSSSTERRT